MTLFDRVKFMIVLKVKQKHYWAYMGVVGQSNDPGVHGGSSGSKSACGMGWVCGIEGR